MIWGYGYAAKRADAQRIEDDLRAVGAERTWVDYQGSDRAERAALFSLGGVRRGDTVLLLDRAHLGRGREAERFEAIAEEAGVLLEVKAPEKPSRAKPGPAPAFAPDYEQERRIRHYWHGPFTRRAALEKAAEVMGREIGPAALNRHLGPRSKPSDWINQAPEKGSEEGS